MAALLPPLLFYQTVWGLPPTVWLNNPWLFFYLLMPMLAVGLVLAVPWLGSIGTVRQTQQVLKSHAAITGSFYLSLVIMFIVGAVLEKAHFWPNSGTIGQWAVLGPFLGLMVFVPGVLFRSWLSAPLGTATAVRYLVLLICLPGALFGLIFSEDTVHFTGGSDLNFLLPLGLILLDCLLWVLLAGIASEKDFRAARLSCRLSLCLCVLLSLGTAGLIVWRAETGAGNRPYCVVIPNEERGYRAPDSLFDLTVWRAQAKQTVGHGGSGPTMVTTFRQHAALLISNGDGVEVLNWSYVSLDFLHEPSGWRDSPNRRSTPSDSLRYYGGCEPVPHALLPLLSLRRLL